MTLKFDETQVRAALAESWSLETAIQWTLENPAAGQCNVTAAVIQDLYGGDILRTQLPGVWHYYNRLEGQRMDLTDGQFFAAEPTYSPPDPYQDEPTTQAEAMHGIPPREYNTLRERLLSNLEGGTDV